MKFIYSTGGREKYYKIDIHHVGDCVCRAICNATGKDYKEVYDALNQLAKNEKVGKRKRSKSSARNGVYKQTYKKYIQEVLGWVWVPCSGIGIGCTVHLDERELPKGNLIVCCSKHLTCVKDGVLYDTYDCSRDNNRCVYGYFREPTDKELEQFNKNNNIKEQENKIIEDTRNKIQEIKSKYRPKLSMLEKKLKEIKHQLTIETNRMGREIAKIQAGE